MKNFWLLNVEFLTCVLLICNLFTGHPSPILLAVLCEFIAVMNFWISYKENSDVCSLPGIIWTMSAIINIFHARL